MENFLSTVCTNDWNLEQDRGRSLADGTRLLQEKFPEYRSLIQLYYGKWEAMLKNDIPETVSLLYQLKEKYNIYGLTNWSAETIPIAYQRFPFFQEFDGIVVSGIEKIVKPDKRIYQLLLDRYKLNAKNSIFIDDNMSNVKAAEEMGMIAIHYENSSQLEARLSAIKAI
jgi:2-haloacid dehalogenase